jgi:antitoxin ParD1/3/4
MPLQVTLTPIQEAMVHSHVASGQYASAHEVIDEALRLMEEQETFDGAKIKHLQQAIHEGLASGEAVTWDVNAFKHSLHATHIIPSV